MLRYLSHLAGDAPARSAFLGAIGPEQFAALLRTASTRYTSTHLTDDADQPALRAVDALGALWAADRAQGGRRTVRGTLLRSAATSSPARLLAIGAFTTGTLTSAELVRWGAALWRRLTSEWQPSELPRPELVGDQVLGALTGDGGRLEASCWSSARARPERPGRPVEQRLLDAVGQRRAAARVHGPVRGPHGGRSGRGATLGRRGAHGRRSPPGTAPGPCARPARRAN